MSSPDLGDSGRQTHNPLVQRTVQTNNTDIQATRLGGSPVDNGL